MSDPVRLRLSRAGGFRLQEHSLATNGLEAVRVTRPSRWGNPNSWQEIAVENEASAPWAREKAVELFEHDLVHAPQRLGFQCDEVAELRGKNLACWCPLDGACHADVLLRLARGDE